MQHRGAVLIPLFLAAASAAVEVEVDVKNGTLRGVAYNSGSTWAFKGIPFALPPVSDLRWRPPQPYNKKYDGGVLDATEFKHNCLQAEDKHMGWPQPKSTLSEDCLYLNVYSPAHATAKKLPVLFWIFGGGFQGGGGNETRLNGTWMVNLLQGEVVVVTHNYRLNSFGFLAAEELRARDPAGSTGSYGIQDQRAAMRWVQENIAAFGGDPDRVYIVGQSAGADSVSNHLVRPKSWGLFSSAGLESGAFAESDALDNDATVADVAGDFTKFVAGLGCKEAKDKVACIVNAPASAVLNLTLGGHAGRWAPIVDGVDLVASGPKLAAAGKIARVPILVGYVKEDINGLGIDCAPDKCAEDDLRKQVKGAVPAPMIERFVELYGSEPALPGGNETGYAWALKHAGADKWAGAGSRRIAGWYANAGLDAFWYKWSYAPEGENGKYPKLAHHACEQPFVFHVLSETPEESKEDRGCYHIAPDEAAFSETIVRYWVNMAKMGRPTPPPGEINPDDDVSSLPTWPAYDSESQHCQMLGAPPSDGAMHNRTIWTEANQDKARLDFWDEVFFNTPLLPPY